MLWQWALGHLRDLMGGLHGKREARSLGTGVLTMLWQKAFSMETTHQVPQVPQSPLPEHSASTP